MKLNKLQKKIGISFKDVQILTQALTHKSFDTKNNYEKLEFLGDRVLGFVISKKLLELYPNEKVGIIDKKLANLVNKNKNYRNELKRIKKAVTLGNKLGLEVHAGHGLTYKSAKILAKISGIKEFNIGHFLIGESIYIGLKKTIKQFKKIIK